VTGLAVAALAASGVYWTYQRQMRAIRTQLLAGSQVMATACGPVEYGTYGAGRPVLIVHATGGGYSQGQLMAHMFVGEGYMSIAPSRFGHLRTPQAADFSAAAQADMLACLLDALDVREPLPVLGMSIGGPIAMQFALRHPDRTTALVLLSTDAYAPPSPEGPKQLPAPDFVYDALFGSDFLFWATVRVAGPALKTAFGATPELQATLPPEERASLDAMIEGMLPIRLHNPGYDNDAAISQSLTTPYPLERISAPTLLVHSRDDPAARPAGAQYTADHIPGARILWYDTGGHVLLGHHAEIKAQVQAFLAGAAVPRPVGASRP
jgi:pimeloyl-ACP methyl ester carboxylesterase